MLLVLLYKFPLSHSTLLVSQVGTEASPFQHVARITLHGSVTDPEIPIYGAKVRV